MDIKSTKKVLVSYNSHIIYQVYIKDQNKVIQVKNFQIFKNYKKKTFIKLANYNKNILAF